VAAELDAIVVDVAADADRPGVAGELARKVADAGVNVEVATHDRIVLATSDDERARAALGL
jgi:predicted regulator of amino acid metabolism with ACT domain